MAASLRQRGPDDTGVEIHGSVGLVSTRLAIVDPGPAGRQPMWDPSGRWLLAYNGEAYDHLELRAALGPRAWRGHSDTETVLAGLADRGEGVLEQVNGPFAVAALDVTGKRVMLARDRFGKKPLYWARHSGRVWFASEVKALLAAGVPARAKPDVLAHTAVDGWAYGRETPFEGVERLRPGTCMSIDIDGLELSEHRFYEPRRSVDPDLARELETLPRRVLVDRLEEALRTAVRRRLMADVPLGTMCSGGLDSTLITAFARDELGPLTAFTCSLVDEPRWDERDWAERAAAALGIELQTVAVDADEWRRALVATVWSHEYPLNGPSAVPIRLMAARARERGIKVLLTGEGADELFAGYPLLHARAELAFLPRRVSAARYVPAFARGRIPIRPVLRAVGAWPRHASVERAASVQAEERAVRAGSAAAYAHHEGARGRFEASLLSGLTCSSFPFLLNRMDKDAMAASVETRVPFLDPDVVGLTLNLPLEARTAQRRVKGILRDVARRRLPTALADRPKLPGMAFASRRRIEEAARPRFLRDGLLRDALEAPRDRWDELLDHTSDRSGTRLWTGEIWARLFLGGQSVEDVERDLWARDLSAQADGPRARRGSGR